MNYMCTRLTLMTLLAVTLLQASLTRSAAAVAPIRERWVVGPFTLTGICPFAVRLDPVVNKVKITTFVDKEGTPRLQLHTGSLKVRVTNLSTGHALDLTVSNARRDETLPDGTLRSTFTGRVFGWIANPSDVPTFAPRMFVVAGRTVAEFDAAGTHFLDLSVQGQVIDVCAALAG